MRPFIIYSFGRTLACREAADCITFFFFFFIYINRDIHKQIQNVTIVHLPSSEIRLKCKALEKHRCRNRYPFVSVRVCAFNSIFRPTFDKNLLLVVLLLMRPPAAHYTRCHRCSGHVHLTVYRI